MDQTQIIIGTVLGWYSVAVLSLAIVSFIISTIVEKDKHEWAKSLVAFCIYIPVLLFNIIILIYYIR